MGTLYLLRTITCAGDDQTFFASFRGANTRSGEPETFYFTPILELIYFFVILVGRGTHVIGSRPSPPESQRDEFADSKPDPGAKRKKTMHVTKIYWPEESRKSEIDILQEAERRGGDFPLISDHIPKFKCYVRPELLVCSTTSIRQFTELDSPSPRTLRIIVFPKLVPIKCLGRDKMLKAFTDCFVGEFGALHDSRTVLTLTLDHFCLWQIGVRHGDASVENLMYDPEPGKGILNDFDLARLADQKGQSARENTGTIPFMALDLLSEEGFGKIPRRYRHEAEAFVWVLIYICGTACERDGKVKAVTPSPFKEWSCMDWNLCRGYKFDPEIRHLSLPVHNQTKILLVDLHSLWVDRYLHQKSSAIPRGNIVEFEDWSSDIPVVSKPRSEYEELSGLQTFARVMKAFLERLEIGSSDYEYIMELTKEVKRWYQMMESHHM